MRTSPPWHILLACGLSALPAAARAATQEHIGSWVLACPDDAPKAQPCLMRANKRFLDKAGVTGDLEIQAQGKTLVPVITLRGLGNDLLAAASLLGKTEASLRFADTPPQPLTCAPSTGAYICAPGEEAGAKLAAALPTARSVTVRVTIAVPGLKPLPAEEKSLDLSGTTEALLRLRVLGPAPVPSPMTAVASQSGSSLMGMADKALKAAGYPDGAARLQALMAKYLNK